MISVDFHSHLLPGADHGSRSIETSLSQLAYAKKYGVDRIIATPHFYPSKHSLLGFIKRRNSSFFKLKNYLTPDLPEIRLGAEILLCENIHKMPSIDKLTVYGSNILLLELPYNDFTKSYVYSVSSLIEMGYNVVIAHADRYPHEHIDYMLEVGASLQLNASALKNSSPRKCIFDWLKNEKVVALGSDIHGADKGAYKTFKWVQKHKLLKYVDLISYTSDVLWNSTTKI